MDCKVEKKYTNMVVKKVLKLYKSYKFQVEGTRKVKSKTINMNQIWTLKDCTLLDI